MVTQTEYQRLRTSLSAANHAYHTLDKPIIDDAEFDELLARVKSIEEARPEWVVDTPVKDNVGGELKRGLYPVKHEVPMLSMGNVFTIADLQDTFDKWKSSDIHASYKYDGLACSLTYRNRRLVEAATRGDRYTGESILHNVKMFDSIPRGLPSHAPENLEVRGELLMFVDEFERYNSELAKRGKQLAVNPRNAAAGIARRLNQEKLPGAKLVFFPYTVLYPDGKRPESYSQSMAELAGYGFELPWLPDELKQIAPLPLVDYIDKAQTERGTLPFGIDGLVFRLNDYALCDKLGSTSSSPRWAIAYKFPPEEKITTVTNIRLQIGRTGNATPVAEVEPVMVGGVTVTNATLHNEDHIASLDIAIGDRVMIRRAGDVVPEISAVVDRPSKRKIWYFPSHCDCGGDLVRPKGQASHLCMSYECHHRVQRAFEHFVSRDALDVDGMGSEIIERLLAAEKIRWLPDIFKLTQQDILDVTSETSKLFAQGLIEAIDHSRKTTVVRFLYALGIPGAGHGTAKRLYEFFGSFSLIGKAGMALLKAVPDVGQLVAENIRNYLSAADWAFTLVRDGTIELTDEQGPCSDFARYNEFVELLLSYGVKGVTESRKEQVREWLTETGFLEDDSTYETASDKAKRFLDDHREILEDVRKDWTLVKQYLPQVRHIDARPLAGRVYVLTGNFDELGSRNALSAELVRLGAKVTGSVSAKTDVVLVGESPGQNKVNDATKHGVPLATAVDLKTLLSEHSK